MDNKPCFYELDNFWILPGHGHTKYLYENEAVIQLTEQWGIHRVRTTDKGSDYLVLLRTGLDELALAELDTYLARTNGVDGESLHQNENMFVVKQP